MLATDFTYVEDCTCLSAYWMNVRTLNVRQDMFAALMRVGDGAGLHTPTASLDRLSSREVHMRGKDVGCNCVWARVCSPPSESETSSTTTACCGADRNVLMLCIVGWRPLAVCAALRSLHCTRTFSCRGSTKFVRLGHKGRRCRGNFRPRRAFRARSDCE